MGELLNQRQTYFFCNLGSHKERHITINSIVELYNFDSKGTPFFTESNLVVFIKNLFKFDTSFRKRVSTGFKRSNGI